MLGIEIILVDNVFDEWGEIEVLDGLRFEEASWRKDEFVFEELKRCCFKNRSKTKVEIESSLHLTPKVNLDFCFPFIYLADIQCDNICVYLKHLLIPYFLFIFTHILNCY